jgi:hypothetical protein
MVQTFYGKDEWKWAEKPVRALTKDEKEVTIIGMEGTCPIVCDGVEVWTERGELLWLPSQMDYMKMLLKEYNDYCLVDDGVYIMCPTRLSPDEKGDLPVVLEKEADTPREAWEKWVEKLPEPEDYDDEE